MVRFCKLFLREKPTGLTFLRKRRISAFGMQESNLQSFGPQEMLRSFQKNTWMREMTGGGGGGLACCKDMNQYSWQVMCLHFLSFLSPRICGVSKKRPQMGALLQTLSDHNDLVLDIHYFDGLLVTGSEVSNFINKGVTTGKGPRVGMTSLPPPPFSPCLYVVQTGWVLKNADALVNYSFFNFWKTTRYSASHVGARWVCMPANWVTRGGQVCGCPFTHTFRWGTWLWFGVWIDSADFLIWLVSEVLMPADFTTDLAANGMPAWFGTPQFLSDVDHVSRSRVPVFLKVLATQVFLHRRRANFAFPYFFFLSWFRKKCI